MQTFVPLKKKGGGEPRIRTWDTEDGGVRERKMIYSSKNTYKKGKKRGGEIMRMSKDSNAGILRGEKLSAGS